MSQANYTRLLCPIQQQQLLGHLPGRRSGSFIYFSDMNKKINILFIIVFNLIPILGGSFFSLATF
jgi:hypothetical protein